MIIIIKVIIITIKYSFLDSCDVISSSVSEISVPTKHKGGERNLVCGGLKIIFLKNIQ